MQEYVKWQVKTRLPDDWDDGEEDEQVSDDGGEKDLPSGINAEGSCGIARGLAVSDAADEVD